MLKKVVNLNDVFCLNEQREIDAKDYLSQFCEEDVRTGKFFLCYCKE